MCLQMHVLLEMAFNVLFIFHAALCCFAAIVIGFDPESYSASEGSGSVTLGVAVLSGSLDSGVSVEVTFTTRDGSGECKKYCLYKMIIK